MQKNHFLLLQKMKKYRKCPALWILIAANVSAVEMMLIIGIQQRNQFAGQLKLTHKPGLPGAYNKNASSVLKKE